MTIELNEFSRLLAESQLISPARLAAVMSEWSAVPGEKSVAGLAESLVKQKFLTDYQSQIILAGHAGPFHYGNYTVSGRLPIGNANSHFKARHRGTQHPVHLEFFAGKSSQDLNRWLRIEASVDRVSAIESPYLNSVYESVVMSQFRFVVSQRPEGVRLKERLPYKGRLPWQDACTIFAQVAAGLDSLYRQDIVHGSISPNMIWLAKSGLAQLQIGFQSDPEFETANPAIRGTEGIFDYQAPEWKSENPVTPAMDVYSLGCSMLRAISGRPPFIGQSEAEIRQRHREMAVPDLSKFEMPADLEKLIREMLAKGPSQRPLNLSEVGGRLETLGGRAIVKMGPSESTSLPAYLKLINQFKPGRDTLIEHVPAIQIGELIDKSPGGPIGDVSIVSVATESKQSSHGAFAERKVIVRRKKNRWTIPVAVGGGLLLLASSIGLWAFIAANRILPNQPVAVVDSAVLEPTASNGADNPDPIDPVQTQLNAIAAAPESERPIVLQKLIGDDRETLWETPTNGPPIDLSGLPAAPKLIFIFRPADLVADAEGVRLIQGLGPEFRSLVDAWIIRCGLELAEIEQLIVSLHTTAEFDYEPFFVITTVEPIDIDQAMQSWNRPNVAATESGQRYFIADDSAYAYYLLTGAGEVDTTDAPDSVSRFTLGRTELVAEVATNLGHSVLSGTLRSLAESTDRQRHVNLLFLRTGLFNDEGQKLMGKRLRSFNRELSILLPDSVNGGMVSLHLDGGTYFEMLLERSLDIDAVDLKDLLSSQMREQRDRLTQFVSTIPPNTYWDKVRLKYDNMLNDFFRNLRWGVEHDKVLANGWMPPMAAHNLLAASELVISFSGGAAGAAAIAAPSIGPQTIEELLAVKRDLNIANPPDLNLLMADIENEVNEDFPGLPFKFRIVLLGTDLQQEGITKNQRPSELNMEQQSLAEILTRIMIAANPSKDITGPADPNCKLVWVVAENPNAAGEQAVLVTTRSAAAKKSYQLPTPFVE